MNKKIEIEKEICEKVERCHYEYHALSNVEKSYIDDHMLDPDGTAIDSPIFKAFHGRTVAALKEYEDAKNDLVKMYNLDSITWKLDFTTREVTVG